MGDNFVSVVYSGQDIECVFSLQVTNAIFKLCAVYVVCVCVVHVCVQHNLLYSVTKPF